VLSLTHDLESETPHGQWFTTLELVTPKILPAST
jgi:hypothetical protein